MHSLLPQDGIVEYFPNFFSTEDADRFFARLRDGIAWRHEPIVMFGKRILQPRLTAWYGEPGIRYRYSGIAMEPLAFTRELEEIREKIERSSGETYNSVLLNLYRTGSDSMGWHSDDEKPLGKNPVIASVSFGETRRFQFRHRTIAGLRHSMELHHGSLLLMRGETQHCWQHAIPKSKKPCHPRINLTFRSLAPL